MPDSFGFSITLRENGLHSFSRGLDAYDNYLRNRQPILLKDAIMFMHHGIELLLKQVLVNQSEYLIFEDLDEASKKQKDANRQGIGIFFLANPPKTVGYLEAINRVEAFVKPSGLEPNLRTNLEKLNNLRNQLEHYSITADKEEVEKLLSSIRVPLQRLFNSKIGETRQLTTPKNRRTLNHLESVVTTYRKEEKEIAHLLRQFKGQTIPGPLLNLSGTFVLPKFTSVLTEYNVPQSGIMVDILAEGENARWVVEVKFYGEHLLTANLLDSLLRVAYYARAASATAWLVVLGESLKIPDKIRSAARSEGVCLTGTGEMRELKHLLLSDH